MMASTKRQNKGQRSEVWKFFKRCENDSDKCMCQKCDYSIKIKDGSTTNLHAHLKRKHDISLNIVPPKNSKSDSDSSTPPAYQSQSQTLTKLWTKLPKTSLRASNITKAIARFMAIDMRPLDTINDRGFIQLIETLEPRYDMNSRTHITQSVLPAMYKEAKEKLKSDIKQQQLVSLTTDSWTGRNSKSFNTVTAQYLNSKWNLVSKILGTREMTVSHTAQNLAEDFQEVLAEYHLSASGVTITTDNAANITSAMKLVGGAANIRCMAHTLNLATQKALKVSIIDRIIGKVRRVVTFFRRSTTANSLLQKALNQLELPQLKLLIDVSTRWNSTLDMLERYLKIRPAIYIATTSNAQLRQQYDTLTDRELSITEELIKVINHYIPVPASSLLRF